MKSLLTLIILPTIIGASRLPFHPLYGPLEQPGNSNSNITLPADSNPHFSELRRRGTCPNQLPYACVNLCCSGPTCCGTWCCDVGYSCGTNQNCIPGQAAPQCQDPGFPLYCPKYNKCCGAGNNFCYKACDGSIKCSQLQVADCAAQPSTTPVTPPAQSTTTPVAPPVQTPTKTTTQPAPQTTTQPAPQTTTQPAPQQQTTTKPAPQQQTTTQPALPVVSTVTQTTTTVNGAPVTVTHTTSTPAAITPTVEPVIIVKHTGLSGGAIGGIAGGAAGGILLLLLAIFGCVCYRNRKKHEAGAVEAYEGPQPDPPEYRSTQQSPVQHYAQAQMTETMSEAYQKHLSSSTATELPIDYRSNQQSPIHHYGEGQMTRTMHEGYPMHLSSPTATEMPGEYLSNQQSPVQPDGYYQQQHLSSSAAAEMPVDYRPKQQSPVQHDGYYGQQHLSSSTPAEMPARY